jgi:WD40 repeat protein
VAAADVRATAWSPDGSAFATASAAGRVVVWDATTLAPLHEYAVPGARVVAFTPDGDTLLAAGETGPLTAWDLTGTRGAAKRLNGSLSTLACELAGRDLTPDEWRQVMPSRPYQSVCG